MAKVNPPGSKLLRKWYKNTFGKKGTYEEAVKWYRQRQDGY